MLKTKVGRGISAGYHLILKNYIHCPQTFCSLSADILVSCRRQRHRFAIKCQKHWNL